MNSLRVPLIIFAVFLLMLVGGAVLLGNPSGSTESATLAGISEILPELNLSSEEIQACLESGEQADRVDRDVQKAQQLGLTGTPAVFLYDTQTQNAVLARGAYPFEPLAEIVQKLINEEITLGDIAFESEALGVSLEVETFEDIGIVEDDHLRGNPEARIALIEYSDLDCPYCATFHGTAIRLVNQFQGDLVWVYRHLPLPALHPTAISKSIVTECAQSLGGDDAFWGVVDSYYAITQQ